MACQASSDRGHASALFEKTSCGPEGSKSWRLAATEVPALDGGCDEEPAALAEKQCRMP